MSDQGDYDEANKEEFEEEYSQDQEQDQDQEEEEEEELDSLENNIQVLNGNLKRKTTDDSTENKITPRFMTKYEKARVIGTRALQISKNAPVMVNVRNDEYDPIAIAEKELVEGKLPFIIRMYLPDGSYEDWNVNNLIRIE